MSETTPDPADVHTGTDRVELTEDERESLMDALGWLAWDRDHPLFAAVESIVAARLQALADEQDELRRECDNRVMEAVQEHAAESLKRQEALRAELAAANTRCAELERERDLAIAHDTQPYPTAEAYEKVCAARTKWHEKAKALQAEIEVNDQYHDHDIETGVQFMRERDALQATLDRVTAVLASVEAINDGGWQPMVENILTKIGTDLRAALTPEGKPQGANDA